MYHKSRSKDDRNMSPSRAARIHRDSRELLARVRIANDIFEKIPVNSPTLRLHTTSIGLTTNSEQFLISPEGPYIAVKVMLGFAMCPVENNPAEAWHAAIIEMRAFIQRLKAAPAPTEEQQEQVFNAYRYVQNRWYGKRSHADGMYYDAIGDAALKLHGLPQSD